MLLACLMQVSFSGSDNWYKCLKGKIGNSPVTMYLARYGERIMGYYQYDEFKRPMTLMGDVRGDSMSIYAYINGHENDERMEGIFKKDIYKCTWNLGDVSRIVEFKTDKMLTGEYEFVYVNGQQKLFNGWKDSPRAAYTNASVWPSDKNANSVFLRKALLEYMNYPAGLSSIESQMLAGKKKYLSSYKKDFGDVTRKEAEKYPSMYIMEEEDIIIPVYLSKNTAAFAWSSYAYTGGAHGNYGTGYLMLDIIHNKKLGLNDVLTDEGINALNSTILEKNFRIQFSVSDTSSLMEFGLFTDSINVTSNFFITPGCIAFDYTPYEIGPYAMGETLLYIPMSDIESYLKPDITSLVK